MGQVQKAFVLFRSAVEQESHDGDDISSLHMFIKESFPGAILLEEHQACT